MKNMLDGIGLFVGHLHQNKHNEIHDKQRYMLRYMICLFVLVLTTHAHAKIVTIQRQTDWRISQPIQVDINQHTGTSSSTSPVWTYHHQSGNGITTLDPSLWDDVNWDGSQFQQNTANGSGAGYVRATDRQLSAFWNAYNGGPSDDFKPAWMITCYHETRPQGGTYNLLGRLSWGLETTSSGGGNIQIAVISGSQVTMLFSTAVSSSSIGEFDVQGFSNNPNLQAIHLEQGDQIAFAIRGSSSQFRTISLIDDKVRLEDRSITRSSDRQVATNIASGSNTHGGIAGTNDTLWTYHHQSGFGINTLDPTLWNDVNWDGSRFQLNTANGEGAGHVYATDSRLRAYWNAYAGGPSEDFKPAWMIAAYHETRSQGATYDITGTLKWELGTWSSGSGLIEISKISGSTVTVLFATSISASAMGQYDVPGFKDNPDLLAVHLDQGDQIVFAVRGCTTQFRSISLIDDQVRLENRSITRASDYQVATNIATGSNTHGSVADIAGNIWTYHHQSGNGINTLNPALWNDVNWDGNRFQLNTANGEGAGHVYATDSRLRAYWNAYNGGPTDDFKPSWMIACYHETRPEGAIYDITGKLKWELGNWASGSGLVEISKISGSAVTVLFATTISASAIGEYEVAGFTNNPDLQSVYLAQGERLAFAVRGSTAQFRSICLIDDQVRLEDKRNVGDVINVAEFGAIADDAYDDVTAIDMAIQAAGPGDIVYFPQGIYLISQSIKSVTSGIILQGDGRDWTTLRYTGGDDKPMFSMSNGVCDSLINAMTLDGNQIDHNTSGGIKVVHCDHLTFSNLRIKDMPATSGNAPIAILFALNVTDCQVTDNIIENIGFEHTWGAGIRLSMGSSFNTITNNTFTRTGRGGILLDNDAADNIITFNTVEQINCDNGPAFGLEAGPGCDRTIVEDNQFDHWISIVDAPGSAIRRNVVEDLTGNFTFAGLELVNASDVVFTDNIVGEGSHLGISASMGSEYILWAYNTIEYATSWGIQLQGDSSPQRCQYFYHNTFANTYRNHPDAMFTGQGHGFRMNQANESIVLDDNTIADNQGMGLQIQSTAITDQIELINNTISGSQYASLSSSSYLGSDLNWNNNAVWGNGTDITWTSTGFTSNSKPTVSITCSSQSVHVGETVTFEADFYDSDGSLSHVLWDFGAGSASTDSAPTYVYTHPGTYRVMLVAWDNQGRAAKLATVTVTVSP